MKILKRTVTNDGDRLMLLFVEMEGWDCWLRPGEAVELRAQVESDEDDFDFADFQHGMKVYPSSGMGTITVHQGDTIGSWIVLTSDRAGGPDTPASRRHPDDGRESGTPG